MRGRVGGELIPELTGVPVGEWKLWLRPLSERARRLAMVGLPGDPDEHLIMLGELRLEPDTRPTVRAVHLEDVALPIAKPGEAQRRRPRQRNVRFSREEDALLEEAARRVGMSPTTLVRALTLNGVAAMLAGDER